MNVIRIILIRCHIFFLFKNAPNSISAGVLPQTLLGELAALSHSHTPNWIWVGVRKREEGEEKKTEVEGERKGKEREREEGKRKDDS